MHGWAPDGKRLLLGAIAPTVPGGTSADRFDVWDGDAVVAKADLPNVLGVRSFSPDGRFFAGTQRTSLYGSELAVFACGTTATQRADPSARSRQARIADDTRRFVRFVFRDHDGNFDLRCADELDVDAVSVQAPREQHVFPQHAA